MTREHTHDRVNLSRLLNRLERAASNPSKSWIHSRTTLQLVQHARTLLESVEDDGYVVRLDLLEETISRESKRLRPESPSRRSVLAAIAPPLQTIEQDAIPLTDDTHIPFEPSPSPFPEYQASSSIAAALLPPSGTTTAITSASAFMTTSAQVQEDLSAQLAQMAVQLKRNAEHFAKAMAEDKAVIEDAEKKLEGNYDVMKKERGRLRDHSGKSGGTTWLVIISVVVVMAAWIIMFVIIRLT